MRTVNILGKEYKIEIHKISEDETLKKNNWAGYCSEDIPLIVLADLDEKEYILFENNQEKDNYAKELLRHEIVHGFLNESGLKSNSSKFTGPWARNEEMVDWMAIQFPKLVKAFEEVGAL